MGLIAHHVIWQQGLLELALRSLSQLQIQLSAGPQPEGKQDATALCNEQVILLQLLAGELEEPTGSRYGLSISHRQQLAVKDRVSLDAVCVICMYGADVKAFHLSLE